MRNILLAIAVLFMAGVALADEPYRNHHLESAKALISSHMSPSAVELRSNHRHVGPGTDHAHVPHGRRGHANPQGHFRTHLNPYYIRNPYLMNPSLMYAPHGYFWYYGYGYNPWRVYSYGYTYYNGRIYIH